MSFCVRIDEDTGVMILLKVQPMRVSVREGGEIGIGEADRFGGLDIDAQPSMTGVRKMLEHVIPPSLVLPVAPRR